VPDSTAFDISAPGLRSLKTYSGTGQPGATAKMAQYRGGNTGCRDGVCGCFTAASRTPPWLVWGCRGRRLSGRL